MFPPFAKAARNSTTSASWESDGSNRTTQGPPCSSWCSHQCPKFWPFPRNSSCAFDPKATVFVKGQVCWIEGFKINGARHPNLHATAPVQSGLSVYDVLHLTRPRQDSSGTNAAHWPSVCGLPRDMRLASSSVGGRPSPIDREPSAFPSAVL